MQLPSQYTIDYEYLARLSEERNMSCIGATNYGSRQITVGVSDEFEDSPVIHRQTISVDELTVKHIEEIDHADVWNTPDKMYPNRPSFYCLEIRRC